MSTTRIEEKNKEARNKPLVLDSEATVHYYPTAFNEESPNDGRSQDNQIIIANGSKVRSRSQGNSEIMNAEFKNELSEALLSAGTLVQQEHPVDPLTRRVTSHSRIIQIYAITTSHVRPELPSTTPGTNTNSVLLIINARRPVVPPHLADLMVAAKSNTFS